MGREVPGDADVRLVETEVDPARRNEVELSQLSRLDEVADGNHRGAVEEGVSRHQHQTATLCELDELEALTRRRGKRLLDEDVSASSAARPSGKCVDTGVANATTSIVSSARTSSKLVGLHRRIPALNQLKALDIAIANRDDLGAGEFVEVPNEVRAPVSEADDCDADRAHRVAFRWRRSANGVRRRSLRSRPIDHPRT